ncbi:hypothetical protein [Acanthopleuribacter pedis]|uniref:Uncharacterized protein n=1 Tax=Acanthopleuribacter pedis TaxID=442870 RepID=A0A8J7PYT7_9BACT|nr:hypothetical protein [Acanthopleuribacter pedis]MBO1317152.1 hypothetical protein [Acanthopleuribacter pedis]
MNTHLQSVRQVKTVFFKNPFAVLPAHTELVYPTGRVTPQLLMHYKSLTQTEAALVITGPATITPPQSRKYSLLRADQPKYMNGLRALTKIIGSNGGTPGIQLAHLGETDANVLEQGLSDFPNRLPDFEAEKLVTAYSNACKRTGEVGYRYIELAADQFLLLHQLIHEDHESLVTEIFEAVVANNPEGAALALRLPNEGQHLEKYSRLFLEAGGDLIAYPSSPDPEQTPRFGCSPQTLMLSLGGPVPPDTAVKLLKKTLLIGLPQSMHSGKSVQASHP